MATPGGRVTVQNGRVTLPDGRWITEREYDLLGQNLGNMSLADRVNMTLQERDNDPNHIDLFLREGNTVPGFYDEDQSSYDELMDFKRKSQAGPTLPANLSFGGKEIKFEEVTPSQTTRSEDESEANEEEEEVPVTSSHATEWNFENRKDTSGLTESGYGNTLEDEGAGEQGTLQDTRTIEIPDSSDEVGTPLDSGTESVSHELYNPQEILAAKKAGRLERKRGRALRRAYRKASGFDAFYESTKSYFRDEREAQEAYARLDQVVPEDDAAREAEREQVLQQATTSDRVIGAYPNVNTPEITKRIKNQARNDFAESGPGKRVYAKLLPDNSLGFGDVGVGYTEFLAVIRQDPTFVEMLLRANNLLDDSEDISNLSYDTIVSRINGGNVQVATFKPPNNQGPDSQRRRLVIMTQYERGIYIHQSQAKMYNADFDGDDMEVSLDPRVITMVKEPWSYYVHNDELLMDLDFMHIVGFRDIRRQDGEQPLLSREDYIEKVVLEGLNISKKVKQRVMTAIRDVGLAETLTDQERRKAIADRPQMSEDAAVSEALEEKRVYYIRQLIDTLNRTLPSSDMCQRVFERMYRHMHTIHVQNQFEQNHDGFTVLKREEMPEPMTISDRALYEIMDGMVTGVIPCNFQEFKVFMNAFVGHVDGTNAPFRFTAAIGKLVRFDERMIIGNDLVIENGDDKTLKEFFDSTVKYIEALHISQSLREKGRDQYYMSVLRNTVISEVGLPSDPRYEGDYLNWLDAFCKSYNRQAAIICEAHVIHRSNMHISKATNRNAVNLLGANKNLSQWQLEDMLDNPLKYLTPGDVAQALIDIYGNDFEVETMFPGVVYRTQQQDLQGNPVSFGSEDIWYSGRTRRFDTGTVGEAPTAGVYVLDKYRHYTLKYLALHNNIVANKKEQENRNNIPFFITGEDGKPTVNPAFTYNYNEKKNAGSVYAKLHSLWYWVGGRKLDDKRGIETHERGVAYPGSKGRTGQKDTNIQLQFTILTAIADKKESISSAYNSKVNGQVSQLDNGVAACRTVMNDGKKTMMGMALDMLEHLNKLKDEGGRDRQLMMDDIIQVLQYFDTDAMVYFEMTTVDGFMNSKWGKQMLAIAREENVAMSGENAGQWSDYKLVTTNKVNNPEKAGLDSRADKLAGLRMRMEYEYQMREVHALEATLGDETLDEHSRMQAENKLAIELSRLKQLSPVWSVIIDAYTDMAVNRGAIKKLKDIARFQRQLGLITRYGEHDPRFYDRSSIITSAEHRFEGTDNPLNYDYVKPELHAGKMWAYKGQLVNNVTDILMNDKLGLSDIMSAMSDVVRLQTKNITFQSYEVAFQLEVNDADVFSLFSQDDNSKFAPVNDFTMKYDRYRKMSYEALKDDVEQAYRSHKEHLLEVCDVLAKNPHLVVQVSDDMVADAICASRDKDYGQTEKGKQHPWINIIYSAISYQRNGGFYDDIYRTDDRALGLQHVSKVTPLDFIRMCADPDYTITVYNDYGEISEPIGIPEILSSIYADCPAPDILRERGKDGQLKNKKQLETWLWKFLRENPRVASYLRMHVISASTSQDGSAYLSDDKTLSETMSHVRADNFASANDISGIAKYVLRDHPVYYGMISMLSKGTNATSRKDHVRIQKIEEWFVNVLIKELRDGRHPNNGSELADYEAIADNVLKRIQLIDDDGTNNLTGLLVSEYDNYCRDAGDKSLLVDTTPEKEADDILQACRQSLAKYLRELDGSIDFSGTISVNLVKPEHVGFDLPSVASFWDVVQEISGAKTAISTGVEGSETYNYAEWASRMSGNDKYALATKDLLDKLTLDQSIRSKFVNVPIPTTVIVDGARLSLTIDEDGNTNIDEITVAANDEPVVLEMPDWFVVPDLSSDKRKNRQLSSLAMYMVSKRSNGAEKFNLKVRRNGYDMADSMTKMDGKYYVRKDNGARMGYDAVLTDLQNLYDSTGDILPAIGKLAKYLYQLNIDMGYEDLNIGNYYNIAELMCVVGSDGKIILRSLEQLCYACKYRMGPYEEALGDDTDEAVRRIVGSTDVEGPMIAVGAGYLDPYDALAGIRPKSKSMSTSGYRGISSGFDIKHKLLKDLADVNPNVAVMSYNDAKMMDEQFRRAYAGNNPKSNIQKTVLDKVDYIGEYNVIGAIGVGGKLTVTGVSAHGTADESEATYRKEAERDFDEDIGFIFDENGIMYEERPENVDEERWNWAMGIVGTVTLDITVPRDSAEFIEQFREKWTDWYVDMRFRLWESGITPKKGKKFSLYELTHEEKPKEEKKDGQVEESKKRKYRTIDLEPRRLYDSIKPSNFVNRMNENIGESNLWIIGPETPAEEIRKYCDRAYDLGITVLVYGDVIKSVPELYKADGIPVSKVDDSGNDLLPGAYMIPMFDIRLNGGENSQLTSPRFAIGQVPFSAYTVMVEDKNNMYGLGEAEYKATSHLVDRVNVDESGTVVGSDNLKLKVKDMFPNVLASRVNRANAGEQLGSYEVDFLKLDEMRSRGLTFSDITIDYGVAEGSPGFTRRKNDVLHALERYLENGGMDENGIVRDQDLEPGDIAGWVVMKEKTPGGGESWTIAPIIPFELHGRKRNVPSRYQITYGGWYDTGTRIDHGHLIVEWKNTAPVEEQYAKYFDSSGAANKGMINFKNPETADMLLMNGMHVDLYSASASFAGRNIGTDNRVKTMASLMAVARMEGYNFADLESSFPAPQRQDGNWNDWPRVVVNRNGKEVPSPIQGPADLKQRLQHGERIGAAAWRKILNIGDFKFSADARIDRFLRHECDKILRDGGNPTDYLMCTFTELTPEGSEKTDANGTPIRYNTHVMWEFEAMFSGGINYENDLLHFLHAMNPGLCTDGITEVENEDKPPLFRPILDRDDIYQHGVLQMQVPFAYHGDEVLERGKQMSGRSRIEDGTVGYTWSNVYIGISFFGEDYSGFSRPNVDGSSNFLDAAMTAGYYGLRPNNAEQRDAARRWGAASFFQKVRITKR